MVRRLTARRTLKWIGTTLLATVLAIFVASVWVAGQWHVVAGSHRFWIMVDRGMFTLGDWDLLLKPSRTPPDQFGFVLAHKQIDWWRSPLIGFAPAGWRWFAQIPIWLLAAVLMIPTVWLWRVDRRRPLPGDCEKCNYNLKGNVSGRCPECGAEILEGAGISANETGGGDAAGV